jgi:hypothetical protein
MALARALQEWREFYLLVGTAGATLLALLFVAVSLGVGYLTAERAAATRTFMSPVVIHFTSVFFISAVALVPSHRAVFFAVLIAGTALVGAVVSAFITIRLLKGMTRDVMDHLAYGLLPAIGYIALLAAAAMIFADLEWSLDVLAGALLLLLIVNIRNAWDLTLAMVRRNTGSN